MGNEFLFGLKKAMKEETRRGQKKKNYEIEHSAGQFGDQKTILERRRQDSSEKTKTKGYAKKESRKMIGCNSVLLGPINEKHHHQKNL